jgi:hypothetical protein
MFEFDLPSLEAHDDDIRMEERERIIALLEARHKDLSACHSDDECQSLKWGVDLAISDIEGDNK